MQLMYYVVLVLQTKINSAMQPFLDMELTPYKLLPS